MPRKIKLSNINETYWKGYTEGYFDALKDVQIQIDRQFNMKFGPKNLFPKQKRP